MGIFANPVKGLVGKFGASMQGAAHFKRFPVRELRAESYKMFRDMGMEEKEFKDFENDIKKGMVSRIEKDEVNLLKVANEVCEEIRLSLRDIIMIGIYQINLLKKLITEDEEIRTKGFPEGKAKELEAKAKQEMAKTLNALRNAGNTLLSTR